MFNILCQCVTLRIYTIHWHVEYIKESVFLCDEFLYNKSYSYLMTTYYIEALMVVYVRRWRLTRCNKPNPFVDNFYKYLPFTVITIHVYLHHIHWVFFAFLSIHNTPNTILFIRCALWYTAELKYTHHRSRNFGKSSAR